MKNIFLLFLFSFSIFFLSCKSLSNATNDICEITSDICFYSEQICTILSKTKISKVSDNISNSFQKNIDELKMIKLKLKDSKYSNKKEIFDKLFDVRNELKYLYETLKNCNYE